MAALRLREQVDKMLADPDLTGEVLLVALTIAALTTAPGRTGGTKWSHIAERVGWDMAQLRFAVWDDVPRYKPTGHENRACQAPMVRRDGVCGKNGTWGTYDVDPQTGEMSIWHARCSRHRDPALELAIRDHMRQWRAQGSPRPAANSGGVLPRYFATDWDAVWDWAAPYRERDAGTGREPTPPRPVLRLIPGGAS